MSSNLSWYTSCCYVQMYLNTGPANGTFITWASYTPDYTFLVPILNATDMPDLWSYNVRFLCRFLCPVFMLNSVHCVLQTFSQEHCHAPALRDQKHIAGHSSCQKHSLLSCSNQLCSTGQHSSSHISTFQWPTTTHSTLPVIMAPIYGLITPKW